MQQTFVESFRLSPQQQHLCALLQAEQFFPYRTYYRVQLEGFLDISRLCKALEQLVERYEILRTGFPRLPGLTLPVQVINAELSLPLNIHDYSLLSPHEQEEALLQLCEAQCHQPLPQGLAPDLWLQDGPLWQVTLVICDTRHHWLLWDLSALHADTKTGHLLLHELSQLYAREGLGAEEAEEPLQYADLAEWQHELLESAETAAGRAYWRFLEKASLHAVSLPYELPANRLSSSKGIGSLPGSLALSVSPVELAQLEVVAQQLDTALSTVLLACWGIVLSRLGTQTDLFIGTQVSGRNYKEVANAVGPLAKYLPLQYQFLEDARISSVVHQIEETIREAEKWQAYFAWQLLAPQGLLDQEPFCPIGFDYEILSPSWQTGPLQCTIEEQEVCLDRCVLRLSCLRSSHGIQVKLYFDQKRFVREDMQRLLTHWQTVLRQVLASADTTLGTLQLLTHQELHQLLQEWNAIHTDYSTEKYFHHMFEEQVQRTPDAIAVVFEDVGTVPCACPGFTPHLTYHELNVQANHLAHLLRRTGVGPDVLAGICMEPSLEMIVALLGVLKTGGAYVPLDPSTPTERLAFMLEETQPTLVLTRTGQAQATVSTVLGTCKALPTIRSVTSWHGPTWQSCINPVNTVLPENLAYIIYTSGSTGEPKGVMITHRGLANYIDYCRQYYQVEKGYGSIVHSSLGFDLTITSLFLPLVSGRAVMLVPEGQGIEGLVAVIRRYHLCGQRDSAGFPSSYSFLKITPAHLELLNQMFTASELRDMTHALIIGGEALAASTLAYWRKFAPQTRLINEYGPTETVVGCSIYEVTTDDPSTRMVPIGSPIANTQLYILDTYGHPVPIGVMGELYIGGLGVARGYKNRPDLTAERFLPHPFGPYPGARLYRTGDLACYRSDGTIEYLGRTDQQVKLRGFRIELGEIEATLRAYPALQEAVVVLREEELDRHEGRGQAASLHLQPLSTRKYLVAYVVARNLESLTSGTELQEATVGAGLAPALQGYLRERLPDYMVPSHVIFLEAMPLTSNGKVDHKALPPPTIPGPNAPTFVAPRSEVEQTLAAIWQQVLGREQVGIYDNFFALGGDSIVSIQIVARVRQAGWHLTPKQLFQHPTIAQLAAIAGPSTGSWTPSGSPLAHMDQALLDQLSVIRSHRASPDGRADPDGVEDFYPLTPLQQGLLFHTLYAPESGIYIEQVSWTLLGEVEVRAFERAWQQIIKRHAILRTAFLWQKLSEPLQVVFERVKLPLEILDWRSHPPQQQEVELEAFLRADRMRGFDVEEVPLIRLALVQLSERRTQVIWTHHHLLLDGWSVALLLQEVLACYGAEVQERSLVLEECRPYRDYISWLQEQDTTAAEVYWRQALAGIAAPTPLGIDRKLREVYDLGQAYAKEVLQVDATKTAQWQEYAWKQQVTLNTLMQAAWALVLSRYSGQADVVFGTVVAGRPPELAGVERMIGLFINTMPVRVQVRGEEEVGVWLTRLQEQQIEQRSYEYCPLVQVQGWCSHLACPDGIPREYSLFESLLVFENYPVGSDFASVLAGLEVEVEAVQVVEQTNYPLTIIVGLSTDRDHRNDPKDRPQSLRLQVSYNRQRFEPATIERLLLHLQNCLQQLVADPQQQLAEISLLTDLEREQQLVQWNATKSLSEPSWCLHQLIEQQVVRTPEAIAVVFDAAEFASHLTYQQLNAQANQLAHRLLEEGIGPDWLVGVYMERSLEQVVALLAVLKAGGAYVPLDPDYPQERLIFLLEDAQVPLVLIRRDSTLRLSDGYGDPPGLVPKHRLLSTLKTICVEPEASSSSQTNNPNRPMQAENLAYLMYTSGSTGKPKGVMVTHGSLSNHMLWMQETFQFSATDRVLQKTPFSFDASVWEFYAPLLAGSCLVLARPHGYRDSRYLLETIAREQISTLQVVPTLLRMLLEEPTLAGCRSLQRLFCGGEELRTELQMHALSVLPADSLLCNLYGPTECTIETTFWVCEREQAEGRVPIGFPIANTQVYLLDAHGSLVPIGVPGEVFIGGMALARGYLNRPDLTAERFVPHPFVGTGSAQGTIPTVPVRPGERLYRTGDLARYRADGAIEYLGRTDQQVKLRGSRIELGEIEATLRAHPDVQEAVVVLRKESETKKYLVAYVVLAEEGQAITPQEHLREHLPDYMVPASMVFLETMPLTPNGKVDRQALPVPPASGYHEPTYVAPRSEVERTLATIWQQVLGIRTQVGIYDNFFALGGDSILNLQIVARARQAGLGKLTPKQLFQHPTIAQLATVVGMLEPASCEQTEVVGSVPLTPIQHWFFERDLPQPQHFNQAVMLQVSFVGTGLASIRRHLQQVVDALLVQHDALRLRYERTAEGWHQRLISVEDAVAVGATPTVEQVDLTQVEASEQARAIEDVANHVQASLDLKLGPLLRAVLFELGNGQPARLLLVIHHLVVDGVSWRVLLEDFQLAMTQLRKGEPLVLPAKTASFHHWAQYLQEIAQSAPLVRKECTYWLEAAQVPDAPLPLDFPEGNNMGVSARTVSVALTMEETRLLLQEAPRPYRSHIQELLLVALLQTLARWMGTQQIRLDLEGHGREDLSGEAPDVSRTVGWFTSLYPVLFTLPQEAGSKPLERHNVRGQAPSLPFHLQSQWIKTIKEQLRRVPHKGIGYGLLRYLNEDRELREQLASAPPSQVSFNYLGQFDQVLVGTSSEEDMLQPASESSGTDSGLQNQGSYLLNVNGMVIGGQLHLQWGYSEQLHRQATIEALAQEFLQTLRELLAHCLEPGAGGWTPSDFPLVSLNQATLDWLLIGRAGLDGVEDLYPLTSLQQGMLFHTLYAPQSGVYVEQVSWTLRGEMEVGSFERTWQQVIKQHAILRTAFLWQELSEPLQIVFKQVRLPLDVIDWRSRSPQQQEADLAEFLRVDRTRGFDVEQAPLMRLTLVQLSEQRTQVIWTHHHLLLDGWSVSLLLQEVLACYEAEIQKQSLVLEERRPYRDYISWLSEQNSETAEVYWRQALAGVAAPTPLGVERKGRKGQVQDKEARSFPTSTDPFRENLSEHIYEEEILVVEAVTTDQWQKYARQQHVTLNTLVQAAWALVLSRYSGQTDVVFGTVVAGRPPELAGVERMVGLFINTVPVRVQVHEEEVVGVWLTRLQEQQIEQRSYEYSSLVQVQGWRSGADPNGAPHDQGLFASLLVFENYPVQTALDGRKPHGLEVEAIQVMEQTNYPLTVFVGLVAGRDRNGIPDPLQSLQSLHLRVSYASSHFERATIKRLLLHTQMVLQQLVDDPQQRLAGISLLTEAERKQLLMAWNATQRDYPRDICIHQLFEQQVEQTPDSVALVFEDKTVTYADLNRRANQLARHLQRVVGGVPCATGWEQAPQDSEVLVGICLSRCIEMVVGLLAVLKAGGTYVPIDPDYPAERQAWILADAQPRVLLTQERFLTHVPDCGQLTICFDRVWEALAEDQGSNLVNTTLGDHTAYVIYTSGSTGAPKGVMISHHNVVNFLRGMDEHLERSMPGIWLAVTSISFDISVLELFWTLARGFQVILHVPLNKTVAACEASPDGMSLPVRLLEYGVSHLQCTPSFMNILLADPLAPTALKGLSHLLLGGEELPLSLVKQIQRLTIGTEQAQEKGIVGTVPCASSEASSLPTPTVPVQLHNMYGPTETTIWSTTAMISSGAQNISLGSPITNTQVYLLDAHLEPVPIGVPGEIYIGGEGLARGYLHRPELTAERFLPNPLVGVVGKGRAPFPCLCLGERLYRTGDVARYHQNGELEYLGRRDQQVKLRGYRIELGEIEAVLTRHPEIQECVVLLREDIPEEKQLVAYIVVHRGQSMGLVGARMGASPIPTAPALRSYLQDCLPAYMIPSTFMLLDVLPLTPNGKVDRRALGQRQVVQGTGPTEDKAVVAPRTHIEKALAVIWTELLNLEQVSITDNFFEVGGHSLLAVQLLNRMNKQFGPWCKARGLQGLSLSTLFQVPTIEQAAALLQKEEDGATTRQTPLVIGVDRRFALSQQPRFSSPCVPIQPSGEKQPFFCVHPVSGDVYCYLDLVKHLHHDRPFYGIQAPGLVGIVPGPTGRIGQAQRTVPTAPVRRADPDQERFNSIEEMAAYYVDEILAVQPLASLPYFLGGYSFGGLVAFEMARQLQARGGSVALLALLDSYPREQDVSADANTEIVKDYARSMLRLVESLERYREKKVLVSYNDLSRFQPDEQLAYVLDRLKERQIVPDDMDISQFRRYIEVDESHHSCLQRYRPQSYSGRITLFRSGDTEADPSLWIPFASEPLEVHAVPGNHMVMLDEPYVQSLAVQLQQCLDKADSLL